MGRESEKLEGTWILLSEQLEEPSCYQGEEWGQAAEGLGQSLCAPSEPLTQGHEAAVYTSNWGGDGMRSAAGSWRQKRKLLL